jgi:hypothetical protein
MHTGFPGAVGNLLCSKTVLAGRFAVLGISENGHANEGMVEGAGVGRMTLEFEQAKLRQCLSRNAREAGDETRLNCWIGSRGSTATQCDAPRCTSGGCVTG